MAELEAEDEALSAAVVNAAVGDLIDKINDVEVMQNALVGVLARLGGKGAALDRLIGWSIPVPPVGVVTTSAYRAFVDAPVLRELVGRIRAGEVVPIDEVDAAFLHVAIGDDLRDEIVAAFELRYLSDLLTRTGGRVGQAAKLARVNERSFYEIMKRRGLRKEEFKAQSRSRTMAGPDGDGAPR